MRKIAIGLFATSVMLSCTGHQRDDSVSLEIILEPEIRVQPMTITPNIPLDIAEYQIIGSGPASTSFAVSTGNDSCTVEDLLPGEWTIDAKGYNSDGLLLVEGGDTEILMADTDRIILSLAAVTGEGTISLTVTWEPTLTLYPSLVMEITGVDGSTLPVDPIVSDGSATVDTIAEAGLYQLIVRLYEGDDHIAGLAELISVLPEQTSAASLELSLHLDPASPILTLHAPRLDPPHIAIAGYDPPFFTGDPISLTADHPLQGSGLHFAWFVNGEWSGSAGELTFVSDTRGIWRVDAVVTGDSLAAGGTATVSVAVYEPLFYGSLIFVESIFDNIDGDGLSDVRSLAVMDEYLYTAGCGENEIGVYRIDPESSKLDYVDAISADVLPEASLFDGIASLSTHAATGRLAAVSAGSGSLLLFAADPDTGDLTLVDAIQPQAGGFPAPPSDADPTGNPLIGAAAVVISPDGAFAYVASPTTDSISSFAVGAGSIGLLECVTPAVLLNLGVDGSLLDGPEEVAISGDGEWVAVACRAGDSVLVFAVDTESGMLSPAAAFTDGVDGVDGLNGATGAAFAPDRDDLYVTGYYDDAVALFSVNDATEEWEFTGMFDEGEDPEVYLHYPRGVGVSDDGTEVYVCASGDDAFTVFSRSTVTGLLSAPVSAVDDHDRNTGFDGIRRVVATESGAVYAAAVNDSAVGLFKRK